MKRTTISLSNELEQAVAAFQRDQAVPSTLTAIAQVALEAYLNERGYFVTPEPRRVLRLTPELDATDTATRVSIEHDRFFAEAMAKSLA